MKVRDSKTECPMIPQNVSNSRPMNYGRQCKILISYMKSTLNNWKSDDQINQAANNSMI